LTSLCAALPWASSASQARAEDLPDSTDRVADAWRDEGAKVVRGDSQFVFEGETLTLLVPEPDPNPACQTLALIGARGLSFHARVGDFGSDDASDERVSSIAGVVEMTSCGAPPLRFVRLTSDGGRGALEIVAACSLRPLRSSSEVLLERSFGVMPPPADPGALPLLPAPEKRADVAEARARREGARPWPREAWPAGLDGKGEGSILLTSGCHTIELFAPDTRPVRRTPHPSSSAISDRNSAAQGSRLDLDATIRDDTGQPMAHDHSPAPDARLDLCVGETTASTVLFEGAPASPVLVTHASAPLPEHLPTTWGPETRARMALALLARHVKEPEQEAVLVAAGASGLTPIPVDVEPGGCYVAVAAFEHGRARGLGLRVSLGARESVDERGASDEASAVAFCAGDRDQARIEVDTRAAGVAWGLALFRVASRIWEIER
jgi:hypothetical protein